MSPTVIPATLCFPWTSAIRSDLKYVDIQRPPLDPFPAGEIFIYPDSLCPAHYFEKPEEKCPVQ